MAFHLLKFFWCEFARFFKNIIHYNNLTDVVHRCGSLYKFNEFRSYGFRVYTLFISFTGKQFNIGTSSLNMLSSVCIAVFYKAGKADDYVVLQRNALFVFNFSFFGFF